ncbi:MAG TPA: phytanoyl-CoA dioxygenase family protein [Tepidisphaeraceae bacterium]|nr:phytanoyl-CoA dioxygenase family protein [Tepidisphaeraceae bacterium]
MECPEALITPCPARDWQENLERDGFAIVTGVIDEAAIERLIVALAVMLTVRLHLDDCGPDNGPLKVIAGSHRSRILSQQRIEQQLATAPARDCCVERGGVVLMRPLLLHASSSATQSGHRRVVHLEYAASSLPQGLEWAEQV